MTNIVEDCRDNVLRWFTGKNLANASRALDLMAESEREGYWVPNARRTADSCLYKANLAVRISRTHGKALEAIGSYEDPTSDRGWQVAFILQFGAWRRLRTVNWDTVRSKTTDPTLLEVLDLAQDYAESVDPLTELALQLDAVMPKPQVTTVGVSPTVTKTLAEIGVVGRIDTVRLCPIIWRKMDSTDKHGHPIQIWVGRLDWPAGTIHFLSRFSDDDGSLTHCQACGHSIHNAFNWVPLLMDNADGRPISLWVGRDCASNLFGIRIKNDFVLER